jgi:hypothetical protein
MVAGQNQDVFGILGVDIIQIAAHRVGGSLLPVTIGPAAIGL